MKHYAVKAHKFMQKKKNSINQYNEDKLKLSYEEFKKGLT